MQPILYPKQKPGTHALHAIFNALEALAKAKVNVLVLDRLIYVFQDQLDCLVTKIRKLLDLDIAQITPPNVREVLEDTVKLRELVVAELSREGNSHGFESQGYAHLALHPILEELELNLVSIHQQSKYNIIQNVQNASIIRNLTSVTKPKSLEQLHREFQEAIALSNAQSFMQTHLPTLLFKVLELGLLHDSGFADTLAYHNEYYS